ncbi:MAG: glycosyltransferase family 39 protein [Nitrospirae bacterium]|nr:glycosyltransferase family 39 protein [Nitrospirota bacterium]
MKDSVRCQRPGKTGKRPAPSAQVPAQVIDPSTDFRSFAGGIAVKITVILLCLISVLLPFYRLGSFTLFDVDEAVFAAATKEMYEGGDWLTPSFNGNIRYDKPILIYWLMGLSYRIFGINETGARMPSAAAALLLGASVFFFMRRSAGETEATHAVVSMMLSLYIFAYSRAAVTDMTLTLFISLSLMSFYLFLCDPKKKMYIYGFYLFSALAFLTKGLIGILFPFGIAGLYLLMTEGWPGIKRLFSCKGVSLFILISFPWYLLQLYLHGTDFIDQFFLKHHFRRFTGVISGHRGPFYYFIPVLLAGMFPWIAYLPAGIRRSLRQDNRLGLFSLVWFSAVFIFFSFSTTKLPNYILPAIPAVSILISKGMSGNDRWKRFAGLFIGIMGISLAAGLLLAGNLMMKSGDMSTDWMPYAAGILAALSVPGIYAFFSGRDAAYAMSFVMLVFFLFLSHTALPLANNYLQGTLHSYSLYARDRLPAGERLMTFGINNPSIVFYSGHRVEQINGKEALQRDVPEGKQSMAISKTKDASDLERLGFAVVDSDSRYALLERRNNAAGQAGTGLK